MSANDIEKRFLTLFQTSLCLAATMLLLCSTDKLGFTVYYQQVWSQRSLLLQLLTNALAAATENAPNCW